MANVLNSILQIVNRLHLLWNIFGFNFIHTFALLWLLSIFISANQFAAACHLIDVKYEMCDTNLDSTYAV